MRSNSKILTIDNRSLFTALLFPVGLRYHALHHLFPSPLYRALGEAHRRLLQALPVDSPYRCTIRTGFIQAVRELLALCSPGRHIQSKSDAVVA